MKGYSTVWISLNIKLNTEQHEINTNTHTFHYIFQHLNQKQTGYYHYWTDIPLLIFEIPIVSFQSTECKLVVVISSMIQENESWFETSEDMSNITNFLLQKCMWKLVLIIPHILLLFC